MLRTWFELRKRGILGLNARNRAYVMRRNPRRRYPLVDDKLMTKRLAIEAGISVPKLYGVIETEHDLAGLGKLLEPHSEFVIKPSRGSGGNGVLVIDGRRRDLFVKPDGRGLPLAEIEYHASNILSGIYSLGGVPDHAMIEYRVRVDPIFDPVSYQGVPDIRLLVYRGVPTMAMVRLPTRQSDGKANLHQGAVGVGVEIATGVTTAGVWHNRTVTEHPDYGVPLAGIQIPNWPRLLELGARCFELTGLGYLGVDIVLDRTYGPLLLELNARPGLGIQIANRSGLKLRLDAIDAVDTLPALPDERVSLATRLFHPTPA
ncbi:MAG: alpha-L-glutamate ligase-like protein [Gammaproteobacteria bacterium]